jgi:hypothetical protein
VIARDRVIKKTKQSGYPDGVILRFKGFGFFGFFDPRSSLSIRAKAQGFSDRPITRDHRITRFSELTQLSSGYPLR